MAESVTREGDRIVLHDLGGPLVANDFLVVVHQGREKGFEEFFLDLAQVRRVFPNALVPIVAAIDRYQEEGVRFRLAGASEYAERTGFAGLLGIGPDSGTGVLDRVVAVTDDQGHVQVRRLLNEMEGRGQFAPGALQALEWCLVEVIDNVLNHASVERGFLMAQWHRGPRWIAVCVSDQGQGILASLRSGRPHLTTSFEAIVEAVQKGVTRDPEIGQGNGLWGLSEILSVTEGQLSVTSGDASVTFAAGAIERHQERRFLSRSNPGTTVDFQFRHERSIDLREVLEMGSEPVNLRMEARERSAGEYEIDVASDGEGTGTRRAGARLRAKILNTLSAGAQVVHVNLKGTSLVSSSFADEVFGKLAVHLGFVEFTHRVRIYTNGSLQDATIQRAVAQRLFENLGEGKRNGNPSVDETDLT